ncbi:MAG: DUF423 domain-containing protein [Cyclobacteriaceae bacterium]
MAKLVFIFAAISGASAVGLGAFGAHVLKSKLEAYGNLATYNTAVQYQFYHTLTLLIVGLLMTKYVNQWLAISSYFMMGGMIIFSGTLYILAVTNIKWLGAITPLGGLGLVMGWICLAIAFWQIKF